MFFLREGGVRLGLVVEGEGGHLHLHLWWSVYDYTSPSVTEFRARQARNRRYWVCVSPRLVSTSWSGFGYSFIHSKFVAHCLTEGKGSPFWEGAPLLEGHVQLWPLGEKGRTPFGRAHPFWKGAHLLEGHVQLWLMGEKGCTPFERAHTFWKGMFKQSGGFEKSWRFTENQADLRNLGALQKFRRIWETLALYRKSGRFEKSWRFSKNQADFRKLGALPKIRRTIESLRALKSPRLVRKPAGLEKAGSLFTV
jgi:hypothetical protein